MPELVLLDDLVLALHGLRRDGEEPVPEHGHPIHEGLLALDHRQVDLARVVVVLVVIGVRASLFCVAPGSVSWGVR